MAERMVVRVIAEPRQQPFGITLGHLGDVPLAQFRRGTERSIPTDEGQLPPPGDVLKLCGETETAGKRRIHLARDPQDLKPADLAPGKQPAARCEPPRLKDGPRRGELRAVEDIETMPGPRLCSTRLHEGFNRRRSLVELDRTP